MTPQQIWHEGGITFYYGPQFEGSNLACPGYKYEPETGPWIAVDVSWYTSGMVQCGDWFLIEFKDGSTLFARALDSGYLADASVYDSNLPFIADVPIYWRDGRETGTGRILNISALMRRAKTIQ